MKATWQRGDYGFQSRLFGHVLIEACTVEYIDWFLPNICALFEAEVNILKLKFMD